MSSEDNVFKPYGSIISNVLSNIIDELNQNICDIIVSFLSIPVSVIIEHGSHSTMVTLTSFTAKHDVLYKFASVIGTNSRNHQQLVGNDAIDRLSSVSLSRPIRNGIITKHSLLQIDKIWNYIFNNLLSSPKNISFKNISSHSVLLILPPQTMNNLTICDKIIEFLFEIYNVPALALMDKASLSCHYYCYSSSYNDTYYKKNAIIVDLGHDICTITPVFNFKSDSNKMCSTKLFSAKSLEQYICDTLKEQQFPSEISQNIKEIDNIKRKYIKIAESRLKYEYILSDSIYDEGIEYVTTDETLHYFISNWILYDIGEYIFNPFKYPIGFPHYIDCNNWIEPKSPLKLKRFTINEIDKYSYLQQNNRNSPTTTSDDEKKEEERIKGLHELIYDIIMQYDDVELRQSLLNNIILTGGMSYIDGLKQRLKKEMIDLVVSKPNILIENYIEDDEENEIDIDAITAWITIIASDRREECNSICASILTSMTSMANIWLQRDEYFKSISHGNSDEISYID